MAPAAAQPVLDFDPAVSATPGTVVAGDAADTVTFTVEVENNGAAAAAGVTVTVSRADLIYVSESGFTSCSGTPTVCSFSGTIAAGGGSKSGDIEFYVDASTGPGSISTSFEAASTTGGSNTPTSNSVSTTVTTEADLEITQTSTTPSEAVPGSTSLDYVFSVTNGGPSDAADVTVTNPALTGLTVTFGGDCGSPAAGADCSLGTLASGATLSNVTATTGTVAADYHLDAANPDPISMSVTVSSTTTEANSGDETTAAADTPVNPQADLTINSYGNGVSTVVPGEPVTYTVEVENDGPSTIDRLTLSSPIPEQLLSPIFSASEGAYNDITDGWVGLDLATGESATLTVDGYLDAGLNPSDTSTISNTVIATPPSYATGSDDSASDNSDTVDGVADLSVVKSNNVDGVAPNQQMLYSITVFNDGPSDAFGVSLEDEFDPATISSASWSCSAPGELSQLEVQTDGDGGTVDGLQGAVGVAVSPDGLHVYVTGSSEDKLAVFERDVTSGSPSTSVELTGELTFVEVQSDASADGLEGAQGVVVSPDGAHVYVAGTDEDKLAIFSRDSGDGTLSHQDVVTDGGGVDGLDGVVGVAISPDGAHLYATGAAESKVAVFSRDSSTGLLTFVEAVADGDVQPSGTVDGLGGATGLAVSPGGAHVYVTGSTDDAVAVFDRDLDTGELAFVEVVADDDVQVSGTVDGLEGAAGIVVSPDGGQVYIAGSTDNAVVAFTRATDGTLTFIEALLDGGSIDGLGGAGAVAIAPDGGHVFVGGFDDGQVAVFGRDGDDASGDYGKLSYEQSQSLSGPSGLASSPDGRNLYATGKTANVLAAFTDTSGAKCPDPAIGSGDILLDDASELLDVPAQTTLTFTVTAIVAADAADSGECGGVTGEPPCVVNTAFVAAPAYDDETTTHPTGVCNTGNSNNNQCSDVDEIGVETDVSVTKSDDGAVAVPGEDLVYTVVVSNAGPAAVTGSDLVEVTDLLDDPAVLSATWTCQAAGNAVCTNASGSGAINAEEVELPAQGSVTFTITVAVDPAATGTEVVNDVSIELPTGFTNTGTDTDSVTTAIERHSDLRITKSNVTAGDVGEGSALDYQLVVENCGPSDVTGAPVSDAFPAEYLSPSWSCDPASACTPDAGSGDVSTTVDLAAGDPADCSSAGTVTITVTGTVAAVAPPVLSNTATVDPPSGVTDSVLGNNSATEIVVLEAEADLSIIKDDGQDTAKPGEEISYSITVQNDGPQDVELAEVTDYFDARLKDVSWTCSSESPARGTLTLLEEHFDGGGDPQVGGLGGVASVVLSPDGAQVYAASPAGDAIAHFDRDAATGELEFVDFVEQGGSVDGLTGVAALALSPDGENLYSVSPTADALAVFTRSATTGALSFVEVLEDDGQGGSFDGLDGAAAVAVSPDGENVYVAGEDDDAVATFDRNTTSMGELSQTAAVIRDTDAGVDGLDGAGAVSVSPDGAQVYVASADDDAVTTLGRDASDGSLAWVSTIKDADAGISGLDGARGLAISGDGTSLYAASSESNAVAAFRRDPATGDLTWLSEHVDGGSDGTNGIDQASAVAISSDGQHLYTAGDGTSESVAVFRRNTATGGLTWIERRFKGDSGAGGTPLGLGGGRSVAVTPDDGQVLVAAEDLDSLSVFTRAGAPPAFAFAGGLLGADPVAPVKESDDGIDGLSGLRALALSDQTIPENLYAVGFGDGAIAAFSRDVDSGELALVEVHKAGICDELDESPAGPCVANVSGLTGAAAIAVHQDNVYLASQSVGTLQDNAVTVFSRDSADGTLTFEQVLRQDETETDGDEIDGLNGAAAVALDPFGSHLYVASEFQGAVAAFSRDSADGGLDFLASVDGLEGLGGAGALALDPDGAHLYVAGASDDALVVFERDGTSGLLSVLQVLQDEDSINPISGATKVPGLDRALGVAVSADGQNVYATGGTDDALVVLSRDDDNSSDDFGLLTWVETFVDGEDGIDGLDGARAVSASPDGKNVYVAGENDDALAIFSREALSGTLTFVEARWDGEDDVDGIDNAFDLAVIPSSAQVYVAGAGDEALALFSRASGSRCTGSGIGDIEDTIDLAAGGQVVYTVTATIDPAATGELENLAEVAAPAGVTDLGAEHPDGVCTGNAADPDLGRANDACRDVDTLTPEADLALTKTDGTDLVIPGEEHTYTLTVTNDGPSNAVGIEVEDDLTDVFPEGAVWSCVAVPSGTLTFLEAITDGLEQDQSGTPVTVAGLDGANSVAVSADGAFLYATGLADNAVSAFAIDGGSGELSFLEQIEDGAGTDGLEGASSVAVSPDSTSAGAGQVYVTARVSDALLVFSREADGTLVLLETFQDLGAASPIAGATPVDGLDQPLSVTLDAAGENVYVAAANSDAITVFTRDGDSGSGNYGELTWNEANRPGSSLTGASSVAVSQDGAQVYATGENEGAVVVFNRDGDGLLDFVEAKTNGDDITGLAGARGVAIAPDGDNVYVAGAGDSSVVVFSRGGTGTLTYRQTLTDGVDDVQGLAGAAALAVSPDGFHVYVAGADDDAVAVLRRRTEDLGQLTFVEAERNGLSQVTGLAGATALALPAGGDYVYAAGRGDDAIVVFERPIDSSCSSGSSIPATAGDPVVLSDLADVAAGSEVVYEVTGTVAADACPPPYPCTSTELVNEASVSIPSGVDLVDPDSTNDTDTDTDNVAARVDLSITKQDGFIVHQGLAGATAVAFDPDGDNVYVTGLDADGVAVFSRDATGALEFIEAEQEGIDAADGLNGAAGLAVSPDGAHVYVAGSLDNAVAAFSRDAASGELEFLEQQIQGFGVDGLLGAWAVAITTDGEHLYAAGAADNKIAVFARDTDSSSEDFGKLTFVEAVADGDVQDAGTVDGLAGVRALVLSTESDNDHLYAAGEGDDAVALFSRDPDTGSLTFVEAVADGDVQGEEPSTVTVAGLDGARSLAISSGGEHLYVAAAEAGAVALFSREVDSLSDDFGQLTFVGSIADGDVQGTDTVDGLAGAFSVVVSPDPPGVDPGGQQVYVAGPGDHAVATFSRDATSGELTFVGPPVVDGEGDADGIAGARMAAVAPDGEQVYVAGFDSDAVAVFDRDWDSAALTGTGALSFVEAQVEGGGGVAPGDALTYAITVTNDGPSDVEEVLVTDVFPGALIDVTYTCSFTVGASCFGGSGDLIQEVKLAAGSSVTFLATGTVQSGFSGTIANTATVTEPDGVIELDPSDNEATDDDTVTAFQADLTIAKISCSDPDNCDTTQVSEATPGNQVYYQVTASNDGPSDALAVQVTDLFPESLTDVSWTCEALPVPGPLVDPDPAVVDPATWTDGDALVDPIARDCDSDLTAIDGLAGAGSTAISPDGLHLYVAGALDHGVAIFRRDLRTGALDFVEVVADGDLIKDSEDCSTILGVVEGLEGASAVVVSPDGEQVYVAGELDDAIAVFSRDSSDGLLTFVEFLRDGVSGVNGLGGVTDLAFSPAGDHLYAAGPLDDAVAVFERAAATGALTFIGFVADGIDSVSGLSAVAAVALSPDGLHLYAAGDSDGAGAVAIFARDASSGALTFSERVTGSGLTGASAVVVSADGAHLYAAGAGDGAVVAYARDDSSGSSDFGALTQIEVEQQGTGGVDGLTGVADLFLSADGEHLYAAGAGDDAVAVFSRDQTTGELAFLEARTGLPGAAAVLISPDGDHAYVTTPDDDSLVLLDRQAGSSCTASGSSHVIDTVDLVAGGTVTYSAGARLNPNASGTLTNTATVEAPDDVLDPGPEVNEATDELTITAEVALTLDKDDGQTEAVPGEQLTYTLSVTNSGPSNLAGGVLTDDFPPELTGVSWTCAGASDLDFVEQIQDADVGGLDQVSALAVSPDVDGSGPETGGEHVYAVARASDALVVFERDAGDDGRLTLVEVLLDGTDPEDEIDGLDGASSVALSPDGLHVYATGAEDDSLAVFSRDEATGELTFVEVRLETDPDLDGLEGAAAVALSPGGEHVYVAGELDDAVVVFSRDADTGMLTYVEREKDGFGDLELDVIDGAYSLAVAPDGAHVVVASRIAGALAVFERDTDTGELTFVEILKDGSTEVPDGLGTVNSVAFSPGGLFVYAASLADDAVTVFSRDPLSGELGFVQMLQDGVDGVDGLDGARSVALSPDGQALFVASSVDDAVAVFQRDGAGGELTFSGLSRDGEGSVDGLGGAGWITISPDGESFYVAGAVDDAVAVFGLTAAAACALEGSGTSLVDSVSLQVGATATYTVTATVDPSATGTVSNTFCVDTGATVNTGDTCATDADDLTPVADLWIDKDDGSTTAVPGTATVYTVTVGNDGPSDAVASEVTDLFPAAITDVDWSCTLGGGACGGLTGGSGDLDPASVDIPAGAAAIFTAIATIDPLATGDLTNSASVAPGPGVDDPDLAGNSDDDVDTLTAVADLAIAKTAAPGVVAPGGPVTFTLSVDNAGPSGATAASVIDTLPEDTTFTSADGGGFWSCSHASGVVTCTAPVLTLGSQPDIEVVIAAPAAAGDYRNTVTVSSGAVDPDSGDDAAAASFEVEATPPTVELVNSDADTGDGELSSMETALVGISRLLVTFSEAMSATAGDPASFQLLAAGDNGIFDTVACGTTDGDDVTVAVDGASYDGGTLTSTLDVGGGRDLPEALYRLAVCPAAEDEAGNPLDGDADGTGGDAFGRHYRVRLDNLLERPYFDFASDLDAWTLASTLPEEITHDSGDADGFPLSGSVLLSNLSASTSFALGQCLDLSPDTSYVYGGEARIDAAAGAAVAAAGTTELFAAPACSGPLGLVDTTSLVAGDTGGLWQPFTGSIEAPATAASALVVFTVVAPAAAAFDAGLDHLDFSPSGVIFTDSFETGDFSAWSNVTP